MSASLRDAAVAHAIRRHRLVVVLRRIQPREALMVLVEELIDAGARIFEITFDGEEAASDLLAVRERLEERGVGPVTLGAGTIVRRAQLEAARQAGADFAVSPLHDPELVRVACDERLPFIGGAMTPTEVAASWEAGATFVKIFPASAVGPSFVRELQGPMPQVELIPTGGVDATNASAFLAAGARAVGIGSAIVRATPAERGRLVASIANARVPA